MASVDGANCSATGYGPGSPSGSRQRVTADTDAVGPRRRALPHRGLLLRFGFSGDVSHRREGPDPGGELLFEAVDPAGSDFLLADRVRQR